MMPSPSESFAKRFIVDNRVGYFWQFLFYIAGYLLSLLTLFLFKYESIFNQDGILLLAVALPILTFICYCFNIVFQAMVGQKIQTPFIKYLGAVLFLELLLLIAVFFVYGGQTMDVYNASRWSVYGIAFISIPTVFNNILAFGLETIHHKESE